MAFISWCPRVDTLLSRYCCRVLFSFFTLWAALGLQCCVQALSGWSEHRTTVELQCVAIPPHWPSVAEHGLQGVQVSAAAAHTAHGLSCPAARGIFLEQDSNPCPLH